jgi:hypothetical protein
MQALDAVVAIGDAPVKGNPNAKLTLIEFSDYQCPFCRRHAENTLPSLDKEYIATGKVRYVFHDFPLEAIHPQAFKAAEAAHCAGEQQKYWEMHGRLFANQQAWRRRSFPSMPKRSGLRRPPSRTAWTVADTPNGCARISPRARSSGSRAPRPCCWG